MRATNTPLTNSRSRASRCASRRAVRARGRAARQPTRVAWVSTPKRSRCDANRLERASPVLDRREPPYTFHVRAIHAFTASKGRGVYQRRIHYTLCAYASTSYIRMVSFHARCFIAHATLHVDGAVVDDDDVRRRRGAVRARQSSAHRTHARAHAQPHTDDWDARDRRLGPTTATYKAWDSRCARGHPARRALGTTTGDASKAA